MYNLVIFEKLHTLQLILNRNRFISKKLSWYNNKRFICIILVNMVLRRTSTKIFRSVFMEENNKRNNSQLKIKLRTI